MFKYVCRICGSRVVPVICPGENVYNCSKCGTLLEAEVKRVEVKR